MEEAERLLRAHDLEIEWEGTTCSERGLVTTYWAIVHTPTGQRRPHTWTAPLYRDADTPTHGVAWTTRHAQRWVTLMVLQIPLIEDPRPGDIVERGFIVRRASDGVAPGDRVVDGVLTAIAPPAGIAAEDFELPDFAATADLPGDEVDAEALAADADAAARGEVIEVPDAARLWTASQAWRAERRASEADLRAAAGVPAGPLDDDGRARLWAFLTQEAA